MVTSTGSAICTPPTVTPRRTRRPNMRNLAAREAGGPAGSELESASAMPRGWLPAAVCVVTVACMLRLYDLPLKPLHHDEGVNGFFLVHLFRQGVYRYDPANYHGPTLYYIAYAIACVSEWLSGSGLSTFILRLGPALFGIAMVLLVLKLRRQLGRAGALTAAAVLALSPGAVYFARDFIHETEFVFFTLAAVMAYSRYQSTRRPGMLWIASLSMGLLFATKETAVISASVLLIAGALTAMWERWRPVLTNSLPQISPQEPQLPRKLLTRIVPWVVAIFIFAAVDVLLFSSFGTNPAGVRDAIRSFAFWTKTAAKEQRYSWNMYLSWMARGDTAVLLLSAVGVVIALWRGLNRFARFAALWAFGLLAAYSLVPYKTPWLMLNFLLPMSLFAGAAVDELLRTARPSRATRGWIIGATAAALLLSAYQSIQLNFRHYDDPAHPYVYVQTRRGFLDLVQQVDQLASQSRAGHNLGIAVLANDYWPLPWYLRDYPQAGYWGKIKPVDDSIVITSAAQEPLLGNRLREYDRIGTYPLRPGVDLVLFRRKDRR
jgi:uncharacterized protein (TIGR03663 family)